MRRQQAAQAERIALLLGEGRALVEKRIAQQRHPVRKIGIGPCAAARLSVFM